MPIEEEEEEEEEGEGEEEEEEEEEEGIPCLQSLFFYNVTI